ncbi:hypothetical protein MtrunA17_Chr5g0448321 [Medicago truncatula]|uniref:Transmembrane protein, putative n=1 Tax=Medicago truncatula TaxID=3880 RepID=G7K0P1_MEDTR|nr:uncharacterized protein LOC11421784 [Medicago truncatula]AET01026.1 transmembrane protein, putative [Medicago truncatula]RHN58179.1 hypothetical protein MtrunA17_Chr5g0448321 [Medicago truncatula]
MAYLVQILRKFLLPFYLFFVLFVLPLLLSQFFEPLHMQYYFNFCMIEKSYMFILVNVLVAFIILYSTLFNASSTTTHDSIEHVVNNDGGGQWLEYIASESANDAENVTESESTKEEEKTLMISYEPDKMMISDAKEDKEEENSLMIIDEDHETQELNKKCEDFIKKMKAKFCSEARAYYYGYHHKSLVLVN